MRVLVAIVTLAATVHAQQRVLDSGTLMISRAGVLIGREEFTIRSGRASGSGDGFTIAATAYYPADRSQASLAITVELAADSEPASFQLNVLDQRQRRIYAQLGPRRVTVRTLTASGESVREYPGGSRTLAADDSSFALYAVLPGSAPGAVHIISPREGRRAAHELKDLGLERTDVGARSVELHHLVLDGPSLTHLWFDEHDRLIKAEVPGAGLAASRAPTPQR